jgi:hypothetical protein
MVSAKASPAAASAGSTSVSDFTSSRGLIGMAGVAAILLGVTKSESGSGGGGDIGAENGKGELGRRMLGIFESRFRK